MDWMEQEQERGITITCAATTCLLGATTGSTSSIPRATSTSPSRSSARCGCSTVRCRLSTRRRRGAPDRDGLAPGRQVRRAPLCFVNKMDRIGADFEPVRGHDPGRWAPPSLVVQLPIGVESSFVGVLDLVAMEAPVWDEGSARGEESSTRGPGRRRRRPPPGAGPWSTPCSNFDDPSRDVPRTTRRSPPTHPEAPCGGRPSPTRPSPRFAAPLQEQGRPADAGRRGRLPSQPARHPPTPGKDLKGSGTWSAGLTTRSRSPLWPSRSWPTAPGQAGLRPHLLRDDQQGDAVLNSSRDRKERIGRFVRMHANHLSPGRGLCRRHHALVGLKQRDGRHPGDPAADRPGVAWTSPSR